MAAGRMARALAALAIAGALVPVATAIEWHGSLLAGYTGGPGFEASFAVSEFTPSLPLTARLGIGYHTLDPGKPAEARRIFINNATNGVPEKHGRVWTHRLDLAYPLIGGSPPPLSVYGGPRYARFTANFKYVGGNEDFDVRARQWGWGLGLDGSLPMGGRTALVMSGGFDYYLATTLSGHDTAYNPDNENVSPREAYEYEDADEAINQPEIELRMMAGIRFRF